MRDLYMKNGHGRLSTDLHFTPVSSSHLLTSLVCASGFVLVYSIVAESSFQDLEEIHENIVRIKDRDDVCGVPSFSCLPPPNALSY